jgi:hypothetical protein
MPGILSKHHLYYFEWYEVRGMWYGEDQHKMLYNLIPAFKSSPRNQFYNYYSSIGKYRTLSESVLTDSMSSL